MKKPYLPLNKTLFTVAALLLISFAISCKKESTPKNPETPTDKITATYSVRKTDSTLFDNDDIIINTVGDSVKITLPATTDVTKLIPDIKADGAIITPKSGVRQDFSKPVTFTVTKGSITKTYIFSVRLDKLKNVVYFGGEDNNFYALNAKKGTVLWKYASPGNFSYSTPTLVNGTIYTTNVDHNLYALNPLSGAVKWKFATGSTTISSPVVANGTVYFGSDDHYVYAVDAVSGNLKWKYLTSQNVDSSPVAENGIVYIGSADGYLYAFDGATGSIKWMYYTGSLIVESSPVISNGVVFVGARNGNLYAVNTANGQLKWSFSTGGISMEHSRPIINNGVVYVASWYNIDNDKKPGSLYAIKESDGSQIWKGLNDQGFTSGPTYANGKLFINSDDGNVYAVDAATGSAIWKKQIYANGAIPTVANGNVFPGGGGGRFFYALDANTGNESWKFPLANSITTSKPLIIDENGTIAGY